MHAAGVGILTTVCSFAGALWGLWLHRRLPPHQLSAEARETVKLGSGLVATMTALVLGLVTASAKNSFDAVEMAVKQSAMQVLAVDRALAHYGPETAGMRADLRRAVADRLATVWPDDGAPRAAPASGKAEVPSPAEMLIEDIRALEPRDATQRALRARALEVSEALLQVRWMEVTAPGSSVPTLFLTVLLFWLAVTFVSFGLFAPRSALVLVVLFVCAVSVGSAVFLVLEMDAPFDGLLRASPAPLEHALLHLSH